MTTENPKPSRSRAPWNKGRLIGQKRPLKPKDVWTIPLSGIEVDDALAISEQVEL